jgi:hypothetical protein
MDVGMRAVCVLLVCGALAACGKPQETAAPPTKVASPQTGVAVSELRDSASTAHSMYEIRYPALASEFAPVNQALHVYAGHEKAAFLAAANAAGAGTQEGGYRWQMDLDFDLRSQDAKYLSVVAEGQSFTGGEHGNPLLASFNFFRPSGKMIGLADLFGDPDMALKRISAYVRKDLAERFGDAAELQRIADGTAPKAENYTVFVMDTAGGKARGVVVLFPTYQVASYELGTQQVRVPAKVFSGLLKSEFRKTFVADGAK